MEEAESIKNILNKSFSDFEIVFFLKNPIKYQRIFGQYRKDILTELFESPDIRNLYLIPKSQKIKNEINLPANQEYPFEFESDYEKAASKKNIRKFGRYVCSIDNEIHDHISANIELEDDEYLLLKIKSQKDIFGRAFNVIFMDEFGSKKYTLGEISAVNANEETSFSYPIGEFPIDDEKLASLKSNRSNEIPRCQIILEIKA